jgi:adenosylmethionine-8-amino-7-oxononanoate aminotransferase
VRPIGNTLIFMPPLAATAADLDAMLGILLDAVAGAQADLARIAAEEGP